MVCTWARQVGTAEQVSWEAIHHQVKAILVSLQPCLLPCIFASSGERRIKIGARGSRMRVQQSSVICSVFSGFAGHENDFENVVSCPRGCRATPRDRVVRWGGPLKEPHWPCSRLALPVFPTSARELRIAGTALILLLSPCGGKPPWLHTWCRVARATINYNTILLIELKKLVKHFSHY